MSLKVKNFSFRWRLPLLSLATDNMTDKKQQFAFAQAVKNVPNFRSFYFWWCCWLSQLWELRMMTKRGFTSQLTTFVVSAIAQVCTAYWRMERMETYFLSTARWKVTNICLHIGLMRWVIIIWVIELRIFFYGRLTKGFLTGRHKTHLYHVAQQLKIPPAISNDECNDLLHLQTLSNIVDCFPCLHRYSQHQEPWSRLQQHRVVRIVSRDI